MGANDTGEQLAAAKEECIRLEEEIAVLKQQRSDNLKAIASRDAEIEALKSAVADAGREALLQAADAYEAKTDGVYFPKIVGHWLRARAGA